MTNKTQWTLQALADFLGAELSGDAQTVISGLNTIQDASDNQLAFLANPNYQKYLETTRAAAVILKPELADAYPGNKLILANPYLGYARLTSLFDHAPQQSTGVHTSAVVDASATLADGVRVGANAVIEAGVVLEEDVIIGPNSFVGANSRIGRASRLHANATIYHGVTMGAHVVIHSGAVIGADGFGFAPSNEGWIKVHQLGGVVLGDRVEVGANTTIDRGALDDTVLENGVIVDNLVQIAHNVRIGENTAIAGCSGIAGSTTIGKNCTLAGGVGLVGHIDICDGVHVTGMSLVTKSITKPGSYSSGTGMSLSADWRKSAVRFNQLDKMASRLSALEKGFKSRND
ncbi:MAG: UDP-3-O-(3-hydroxymyristoyl)glucosamine N-acyltransferase [Candidatus Pelagadaptatus aseana]|uniref:UDP-3-O-(3-hydroxymyristoyl)glucosamine N-acyltransferase n=1 Tax=Candidatus Pelagadaptatus aseana TaxID=3120508 RepID=UPI0039B2A783